MIRLGRRGRAGFVKGGGGSAALVGMAREGVWAMNLCVLRQLVLALHLNPDAPASVGL